MTYRLSRKRSTTTFKINDQYCKVFLTPVEQFNTDNWVWKVGFAVSKSKRQLNDWNSERKNKRAQQLRNSISGRSGIKTITEGFRQVLLMRWNLEPGDALFIDCTSKKADAQFRAFSRWLDYHPDWNSDVISKMFWWHRPPYGGDPIYELGRIIPVVPEDPLAPLVDEQYFACFRVDFHPGVLEDMLQSMVGKSNQSDPVQLHYKADSNQSEENQLNLDHPLQASDQT
jgi:hypothetical protein